MLDLEQPDIGKNRLADRGIPTDATWNIYF